MNPIFLNSPSGQIHMKPMDEISGFQVRPGFYELNGAMAIPGGVNFTRPLHRSPFPVSFSCSTGQKTRPMRPSPFRSTTASATYIP